MVMVLSAQVALTPEGKPFAPATPELGIPEAPVVVNVIFVIRVLTHNVGLDDGSLTVQLWARDKVQPKPNKNKLIVFLMVPTN